MLVYCYTMFECGIQVGDDPSFPDDIRRMLSDALGNIVKRLQAVNILLFVVQDIAEALRHQLSWYRELRMRVSSWGLHSACSRSFNK